MIAKKSNKQLRIAPEEADKYAGLGFDICEERDGRMKVVRHGVGKTVPYAQHEALKAELAALKEAAEKTKTGEKPLDKMTANELKAYAEERGVDLQGLTRKEDILAALGG